METVETIEPQGVIAGIVHKFLTSHLSIIMIIMSFCLGIAAILITPREEEPQIIVPLADIFVQAPGATPEEVEQLIATPLERYLWQIDGVEYVYSTSMQDMAVITVRFFVGEDRENALIKLYNRMSMHADQAPPIVKGWLVKPVEIDDVPIVNLTLFSDTYDDHALRRIGEEVLNRLSSVTNISRTDIVGGRKREIRVELNQDQLQGLGIGFQQVMMALQSADASVTAGKFTRFNQEFTVSSHAFLTSAEDVRSLVVGVSNGRPVYLRDVASIIDGPEINTTYSRIGFSHYYRKNHHLTDQPLTCPSVTLALAKKRGTNAVNVAQDILNKLETLKQTIIPSDVHVEVTRNYGETAQFKVNELLSSLAFAIVTVVALLAFTLGWREALVVALAVPISFSLALFVNFIFGYTINRVTLFALILSLGLVVDDPITNVDNIQRHILDRKRNPIQATLFAVNEVLPPVIMSTIAIIICFVPLFFISGMMGPYMAPMAANVPMTVIFSTICAITIVPWMSYLLLKNRLTVSTLPGNPSKQDDSWVFWTYRKLVNPFLTHRMNRYILLIVILGLMGLAVFLAMFRYVPLKMLPFDNKNEFQIIVDMKEGTSLEITNRVIQSYEDYLRTVPEVTSIISFVGESSPMDFNGLVRHYYLRKGAHMADIRVNLVHKDFRIQQSHELVLRLRKELETIATQFDANMKIVELPPGPPVFSTIVAELYGEPDISYDQMINASEKIKQTMRDESCVVDIDDTTEAQRLRIDFILDKEKAALHGVPASNIIQTLRMAVSGTTPATVHIPTERQALMIKVILPRVQRSGRVNLSQIPIQTRSGKTIPLAELVRIVHVPENQPIYHKNLERVVYVMSEMAGRAPAEAILDMQARLEKDPMPDGIHVDWAGEGEWKITIRVFIDMGIAFAAALLGIYILLIIQTNSFFMPLLIMMAIPLTLIGAMPGFWLLNLVTGSTIGGFDNPVFFTATGMIGMIALGGIVIRNSLVLIEFIQDAQKQGVAFKEAILQSGAIRMRPILLTAATTALGAWPITLDPIFSGLAWTLIFGLFASTIFTLIIIPVTYYALYKDKNVTR
ncbi:MAG: efflux RND transporter permease subunit [Candidatus Magnetomorum sp.]|nr:efflux RND transporter permease subunit [Candidatus Magnetomorum sp.]